VALADPEGAPVDTEITDPIALRAAGEIRTPLPQARAEVRNIAPPQGRVLLGREATASAFFEEGRRASVLHLAMHASIDTQNPYASALLMAPDDHFHHGVVAAPDIARSRLSADLVSLSGCSTVGGYQVLGEGTFGLVRAFLEAGSRSVVASRWDVEDAAARRFMELFYDGLGRGEARDAALSSARRRMRKEGFGIRDRAAFALVGAVSGDLPELRRTGPRTRQWFALGAVVLVAFALLFGQRRRRAT
jgi:CHAT domain-containing protein